MIPARLPVLAASSDRMTLGRGVRAIANQQDGLVTRRQLLELGLTPASIDRHLRDGRFRATHRGVYCVGHDRLTPRARWIAAILALGPGAVLSHGTAAAARGLLPWRAGPVDVTTDRRVRRRNGITVHNAVLPAHACTTVDGLPCTSTARTLIDLAAQGLDAMTRRAWDTAASRRQLRLPDVERELAARRGRPGAPAVRRLLAEHSATLVQRTRSELELEVLGMIARSGLPAPIANALLWIGDVPYEIDLLWPAERLAVEVDPWSTHGNEISHRNDSRRAIDLQLAGWRPASITEADVAVPEETIQRLDGLLKLAPPARPAEAVSVDVTFSPSRRANVTATGATRSERAST